MMKHGWCFGGNLLLGGSVFGINFSCSDWNCLRSSWQMFDAAAGLLEETPHCRPQRLQLLGVNQVETSKQLIKLDRKHVHKCTKKFTQRLKDPERSQSHDLHSFRVRWLWFRRWWGSSSSLVNINEKLYGSSMDPQWSEIFEVYLPDGSLEEAAQSDQTTVQGESDT